MPTSPTDAYLIVQYNTNTKAGSATKDPEHPTNNPVAANGDITVDPGPGNTITFTRTGGDPPRWKFVGIAFDPASTALTVVRQSDSVLVVGDDNENNSAAPVSYEYTITVEDVVTRQRGTIDPKVINKTAQIHTA